MSPGVSAALAIIVITAVALTVALVFTIVAIFLRRRKKQSNYEVYWGEGDVGYKCNRTNHTL